MNARTARERSLRNMEQVLWEQLPDDVCAEIGRAVRDERQSATVFLLKNEGIERALSNLRMLGYEVHAAYSADGAQLNIEW